LTIDDPLPFAAKSIDPLRARSTAWRASGDTGSPRPVPQRFCQRLPALGRDFFALQGPARIAADRAKLCANFNCCNVR